MNLVPFNLGNRKIIPDSQLYQSLPLTGCPFKGLKDLHCHILGPHDLYSHKDWGTSIRCLEYHSSFDASHCQWLPTTFSTKGHWNLAQWYYTVYKNPILFVHVYYSHCRTHTSLNPETETAGSSMVPQLGPVCCRRSGRCHQHLGGKTTDATWFTWFGFNWFKVLHICLVQGCRFTTIVVISHVKWWSVTAKASKHCELFRPNILHQSPIYAETVLQYSSRILQKQLACWWQR